jgi:cell division septal protein FtsQ
MAGTIPQRGGAGGRSVDRGVGWRRTAAVGLAAAELVLLVAALAAPPFGVRSIEVTGARRLQPQQVVAAAGLQHPGSIFAVDPGAVRRRLQGSTWVRDATVSTSLPDRVTVHVEEWQPVATFHAGSGAPYFLSSQAVALGPVGEQDSREGLVDIEGPAGAEPRAGRRALDPQLLTALVNIERALPRLIGQEVKAFTVDSCGNLTLLSVRGWRAQFGRVLTPEEFATLQDKLAALRAVSTDVDYNSADLDNVNVMNPSAVAVRLKSKPTPSPAGRGQAAASTRLAQATPAPAAPAPAGPNLEAAPCR